ncbi:hypothetical protein LC605_18665 [Nostoc sp. CHAB 5836]|uniref:hypothetical protein n=1 Tax=Nostoc sp. CHAB 5836 TaxID=2780404 RepID=UPI001E2CEFDF|nr:hypothetical protein [Nostoc sp. CHAB 5836]MCC5617064.1 hypothetical protein [Nostoc sp. CHAB 5836]
MKREHQGDRLSVLRERSDADGGLFGVAYQSLPIMFKPKNKQFNQDNANGSKLLSIM